MDIEVEKRVEVKIQLTGGQLPEYKNPGDAGADIRAMPNDAGNEVYGDDSWLIRQGETKLIPCGFRMAIPEGWEIQVRSRSGLSKNGLVVANSPGTIDSGYRGEVMVLLHNQSPHVHVVKAGDRIAQIVLKRAPTANFVLVDDLDETVRGEGGFGSTGVE